MTRTVYWRATILYGMFAAAWVFWAAFGSRITHAVFHSPVFSIEDRTVDMLTSTEFRFPDKFDKTLNRYGRFRELYREEISTPVPGLEYTGMGDTYSRQMVPQGICMAGDYMLVSAYDGGKSFDGSGKVQNSVIYVLSNERPEQREFLTTLVLPDVNHVGGITFDGERVWIAKSTTGYISAISYGMLEEAVFSGEESYRIAEYSENIYCGVTASFVTCCNDRLWVGTYRSGLRGAGLLNCYRLVQENGVQLEWESAMDIPPYAQGISFAEQGGRMYAILSTSCGRYSDSQIYIYEASWQQGTLRLDQTGRLAFPPMAEEVVSDGEYTYILFESAASCYSGVKYRKCAYPVDRICGISTRQLLMR